MANNRNFSDAVRNARADAITTFAGNAALLRIYDGTQPTDADTAIGAQVLLAELTLGSPMASGASNGVLTYGSITQDSSANNTGTAAWYRIVKADGTTIVEDGTVGTSGCDLNLTSTSITSGVAVSITSFVSTEGNV